MEDFKLALKFSGKTIANYSDELLNDVVNKYNSNPNSISIISAGGRSAELFKLALAMLNTKTPKEILAETKTTTNSCNCNTCQAMCHQCPCLGTPREMMKLATMPEYQNNISISLIANPIVIGEFGKPITMLTPDFDEVKGHCSFLVNGLCSLHDAGLKPLEGKTASCNVTDGKKSFDIYKSICEEWEKLSNNFKK